MINAGVLKEHMGIIASNKIKLERHSNDLLLKTDKTET